MVRFVLVLVGGMLESVEAVVSTIEELWIVFSMDANLPSRVFDSSSRAFACTLSRVMELVSLTISFLIEWMELEGVPASESDVSMELTDAIVLASSNLPVNL